MSLVSDHLEIDQGHRFIYIRGLLDLIFSSSFVFLRVSIKLHIFPALFLSFSRSYFTSINFCITADRFALISLILYSFYSILISFWNFFLNLDWPALHVWMNMCWHKIQFVSFTSFTFIFHEKFSILAIFGVSDIGAFLFIIQRFGAIYCNIMQI